MELSRRALVQSGTICALGTGMMGATRAYAADEQEYAPGERPVRPHHFMCCVKNTDEAVRLWTDVMGLTLRSRLVIGKSMSEGDGLEDAQKTADSDTQVLKEICCLSNDSGVCIELVHDILPLDYVTPPSHSGYGYTGFSEFAFMVDDIYAWYDKVLANGYTPQAEPWPGGEGGMTFVFYDTEGNMIQLWQDFSDREVAQWDGADSAPGDVRTPEQIELCAESYTTPAPAAEKTYYGPLGIERFDHMHVAAPDLDAFTAAFEELLGGEFMLKGGVSDRASALVYEPYPVGIEAFDTTGSGTAAASQQSAEQGEGVFTVTFKVADVNAAEKVMNDLGYETIEHIDNDPIFEILFDTKDAFGFYLELVEYPMETMRG